MNLFKESNVLNDYFDMLQDKLQYKHWYSGHFHLNMTAMGKHTILYNEIIKLGEDEKAFCRTY